MIYQLRVILDTQKNVFCDIQIREEQSLYILHESIKKAFQLKGEEMASFYLSNLEWEQGEEIPLEDMMNQGVYMDDYTVAQGFKNTHLIYVYDFLALWAFMIEKVAEVEEEGVNYPKVLLVYGEMPSEPEDKKMEAVDFDLPEIEEEFTSDDFLDDFDDEFNEGTSHQNIDDLDI